MSTSEAATTEADKDDKAAVATKEDGGDSLMDVDKVARFPLVRRVSCELSRLTAVVVARAHISNHTPSDHTSRDKPGDTPDVSSAAKQEGH